MNISPKTRTIMVVDDERVDQVLYARVLRKAGLCDTVYGFVSPNAALEFLRETQRPKIDVILLDVNMPERSGFDFLDVAMSEHGEELSDALVLMVSSVQSPQNQKRAEEIEVIAKFLHKPLTTNHARGIEMLLAAQESRGGELGRRVLH